MKWFNLKKNLCPQCNKDFMDGYTEEPGTGPFGLKMLVHECGFKITERRYREIITSMVNKELEKKWSLEEDVSNSKE